LHDKLALKYLRPCKVLFFIVPWPWSTRLH